MKNLFFKSIKFDPLNNFLFYKIFGEKGNEVQLLGFINAVLGKTDDKKLVSVDIQENVNLMAEIISGKSCVLDVRAKLHNGDLVNIEVQLRNKYNFDRRSLYYQSKVYSTLLSSGDDYIKLPNIIAINIVNFDFPKTKSYHSCFRLREECEHDIILTDALEVHFINMVRFRRQLKGHKLLNDPLFRWLVWSNKDSPPEILKEVLRMDTAIQAAEARLEQITQSDLDYWTQTSRLLAECDRTSEINYAVGERNIEIARNLLAKGLTPELVSETTGLSLKEISKL
ncbi:MAG: Rpn family recombination-promoting nuclease/putative transposase [Treponema sp.]|nr:Rpn family recombination-promoting nuclease/putative transposase [Treponema sp.]